MQYVEILAPLSLINSVTLDKLLSRTVSSCVNGFEVE